MEKPSIVSQGVEHGYRHSIKDIVPRIFYLKIQCLTAPTVKLVHSELSIKLKGLALSLLCENSAPSLKYSVRSSSLLIPKVA